ncbi:hypothetical protein HN873_050959 [Arachis hypogaea]
MISFCIAILTLHLTTFYSEYINFHFKDDSSDYDLSAHQKWQMENENSREKRENRKWAQLSPTLLQRSKLRRGILGFGNVPPLSALPVNISM